MQKTILVIPHTTTGGIASFRLKFTAGLEQRGWRVTEDPNDPQIQSCLVIGGTRNLPALYALRRRKIPIIQRLNGMNWVHKIRPTGAKHYLRSLYGNWVLNFIRTRLATGIIYQSDFSRRWWHREYGPAPVAEHIVYNGVDLAQYTPDGPHERPQTHYRVLLVEGSLAGGYDFGLRNAVEMCRELQGRLGVKVELMVASKVPEDVRTMWDAEAGVPLTWAGFVPREAIPRLDRSAHVMFPPDPNAACPNSVIEALACGLPVAAFQTGSLPELVPPGAGFLAPYGGDEWKLEPPNIAGLADAAYRVIQGGEALRAGARAKAEADFGLDKMVAGYLAILG